MISKLDRTWWFAMPISFLAAFLTLYVVSSAGIAQPYSFSQWFLYFMCFLGIHRGLSFLGWLLVVLMAPQSKVLERTK